MPTEAVPNTSMDSAGTRSRTEAVLAAAGCLALVILVVVLLYEPSIACPVLPVLVSVASALMFAAAGFTALLLHAYARASGQRGYLVLSCTYLGVALLNLVGPLMFPGGIVNSAPPRQVWGGAQSWTMLYALWHWAVVLGVLGAAMVFDHDGRRHRRPGISRSAELWALAGTVVGCAGAVLWVGAWPGTVPVFIDGQSQTGLTVALNAAQVAVTVVGVAYLLASPALRGSLIGRWLLAVLVFMLTASLLVIRPTLNMLTYYANLAVGVVALSLLLAGLSTALARVARASVQQAEVDSTTRVASRSAITARIEVEVTRASDNGGAVGLLWVDLDGFKAVNDELGHAAGDDVLRTLARRLESQIRPGDQVGRIGGDEFVVLLCDLAGPVDDGLVDRVAAGILSGVREPLVSVDSVTTVTASVGVAACPADATTAEDLLARADLAMFDAKDHGGDRAARFSTGLEAAARTQGRLRHDLSAALRACEFDLDYQPIVDVRTGRALGAEALVRWVRDGERTPAGSFLPFAERSGQVLGIGHAVIGVLEADYRDILAAGGDGFFLTFNLSVKELADTNLVERVLAGPLPTCSPRIVVEVTESFEIQAATDAADNLSRLAAAGIPVAIDDFGTGFSNLARLTQLRPSILKIDRALVAEAAGGTVEALALLTAAIGLAPTLRCEVVAEGVETGAELAVVLAQGVPMAQGYLFSRPMPKRGLLELLRQEHAPTPPSDCAPAPRDYAPAAAERQALR